MEWRHVFRLCCISRQSAHIFILMGIRLLLIYWILFLMSFSSLRIRDDSCSGVGALKDNDGPLSGPDGGLGNLCLNSSSMVLCSLRFRPYRLRGERGRHFRLIYFKDLFNHLWLLDKVLFKSHFDSLMNQLDLTWLYRMIRSQIGHMV